MRNLGQTATYQGEWTRAFSLLAESLAIMRDSNTPDDLAGNLEGFAIFAEARGDAKIIPALLGAANSIRIRTDCPLYPSERIAVDKAAATARTALGVDLPVRDQEVAVLVTGARIV
jgi:hypothetical protein